MHIFEGMHLNWKFWDRIKEDSFLLNDRSLSQPKKIFLMVEVGAQHSSEIKVSGLLLTQIHLSWKCEGNTLPTNNRCVRAALGSRFSVLVFSPIRSKLFLFKFSQRVWAVSALTIFHSSPFALLLLKNVELFNTSVFLSSIKASSGLTP